MTYGDVAEGQRGTGTQPSLGMLPGQPRGGGIKYDIPKERKWGDQTERERLNGEWLCTGRAGHPGC